jgi:HEAT repeat protein
MYLIALLAIGIIVFVWWVNSQRTVGLNEKMYLRSRGYDNDDRLDEGPPVPKDTRLFGLIESLGDLSPYARQRAAEDLGRMCASGKGDERMLSPLMEALDDSDASVRSTVAAALGCLGDGRAIDALKGRLEVEESIHVRAALNQALDKLSLAS